MGPVFSVKKFIYLPLTQFTCGNESQQNIFFIFICKRNQWNIMSQKILRIVYIIIILQITVILLILIIVIISGDFYDYYMWKSWKIALYLKKNLK